MPSVWQWVWIAAWVGLLLVLAIGFGLSLARISGQADRAAEALHREAAEEMQRSQKEPS